MAAFKDPLLETFLLDSRPGSPASQTSFIGFRESQNECLQPLRTFQVGNQNASVTSRNPMQSFRSGGLRIEPLLDFVPSNECKRRFTALDLDLFGSRDSSFKTSNK